MRKKYCSIMSERCRCSRIFYASIHFVPLMHKIWSSLSIIRKCNSHNRVEKYNIFYSAADCNFLHPLQEVLCQWSYLFCLCIPCECVCRFLFLCVCVMITLFRLACSQQNHSHCWQWFWCLFIIVIKLCNVLPCKLESLRYTW